MSLLINEEAAVGETAVHLRAIQLADAARAASRLVAAASAEKRTQAIELLAAKIDEPAFRQQLLTSNAGDVAQAREAGQTAAWLDRLSLDEKRLDALSRGLREVAAQPDPVGEVTESRTRPNGLRVEKIRSPLGSILMIYEARPNVTADAAALCLRAGNAALLRGGKEAQRSNALLIQAAQGALEQAGLPRDAVQFVEPDRALLDVLLTLEDRPIARPQDRRAEPDPGREALPGRLSSLRRARRGSGPRRIARGQRKGAAAFGLQCARGAVDRFGVARDAAAAAREGALGRGGRAAL
jgi:hypothetical protein